MSEITLDPTIQAQLGLMGDMPYLDLESMPLDQAMKYARPDMPSPPPPDNCKDVIVAGFDNAELRIRLYFPQDRGADLAMIMHFHGGGFVGGTVEMDDHRCSWLAQEVGCVVISVDYRLAPEYPFPVAIEDGFAVWRWALDNAALIGWDKQRSAVSGSSAGGHVAVGITHLALTRNLSPPGFQLLVYPVLDPSMSADSYSRFSNGPFMTRARMAWYWQQYTGTHETLNEKLWSPLLVDMKDVPPTHVITAEYDVLRDEGEAYAQRLQAAGVSATMERYPQMIHGFITMVPDHQASLAAMTSSAEILRKRFAI